MVRFGEILKNNKPGLVISQRYDSWMAKNSNPRYSTEALDFGREQLYLQSTPRDRRGTVSSSSLKKCWRRQIFTFLGVPEQEYSAKTSAIFVNGTFMHIRWQMAGLTEGFLTQCEIGVGANDYRLSGTLDAVAYEDSVVELKSCNSNNFSRAMAFGPIAGHEYQVATYCLVTGRERGILVYENKDCVPDYARALTRRGWMHHWQLKPDDQILTYSMDRDRLEWEPYSNSKVVHSMLNESVYRVGNKHASFVTTKNHRWAVRDHQGQMSRKSTHELNSNSWIPRHAPYAQDESVVTPYEAEVIGWIASDGWIDPRGWYTVCQKKAVGCRALDDLLDDQHVILQGPYDGVTYYYLRGSLRQRLREIFPTKNDLMTLVTQMSVEALQGLVRGLEGGDGSWASAGNKRQFTQRDGVVKEAYQLACTLLGQTTNLNSDKLSCYPGVRRWMRSYASVEEKYTGEVWCPQTQNGFWLMEQHGKITITGNTQEFTEIVLDRADLPITEVMIAAEKLWDHIDRQVLPDPLDAVYENKAPCSTCQFRNVCLKLKSWVEADDYSHRSRAA